MNKEVEVLIESVDNGMALGHSSNYLEVAIKTDTLKQNDLVKVVITKVGYTISEGEVLYVF